MAPPDTTETFPAAWVVRCVRCRGGLMYGLDCAWTEAFLVIALQGRPPGGWLWLDRAPIDRVLDLDYCTCTENPA